MNAPLIFTADARCTHCGGPVHYQYVRVAFATCIGAGNMTAWCPACNVEVKTPDTLPLAPPSAADRR